MNSAKCLIRFYVLAGYIVSSAFVGYIGASFYYVFWFVAVLAGFFMHRIWFTTDYPVELPTKSRSFFWPIALGLCIGGLVASVNSPAWGIFSSKILTAMVPSFLLLFGAGVSFIVLKISRMGIKNSCFGK